MINYEAVLKSFIHWLNDDIVYKTIVRTRNDEYIPIQYLDMNEDIFLDNENLHYSYQHWELNTTTQAESLTSYFGIDINRDGSIVILYNPSGSVRDKTPPARFNISTTEEELFQLSTIQEDYDVTMEVLKEFAKLHEKYFGNLDDV